MKYLPFRVSAVVALTTCVIASYAIAGSGTGHRRDHGRGEPARDLNPGGHSDLSKGVGKDERNDFLKPDQNGGAPANEFGRATADAAKENGVLHQNESAGSRPVGREDESLARDQKPSGSANKSIIDSGVTPLGRSLPDAALNHAGKGGKPNPIPSATPGGTHSSPSPIPSATPGGDHPSGSPSPFPTPRGTIPPVASPIPSATPGGDHFSSGEDLSAESAHRVNPIPSATPGGTHSAPSPIPSATPGEDHLGGTPSPFPTPRGTVPPIPAPIPSATPGGEHGQGH
jgi:hypothetical protein